MRTGSCWFRLPPTSLTLVTLNSLLTPATVAGADPRGGGGGEGGGRGVLGGGEDRVHAARGVGRARDLRAGGGVGAGAGGRDAAAHRRGRARDDGDFLRDERGEPAGDLGEAVGDGQITETR